jgi:choline oxidase
MSDQHYDYVVVGGGTAGAVVAARLAEDSDASVCLVESGPNDADDMRVLTLPRWEWVTDSLLTVDYPIEEQARGNGLILHSRGRLLGGCSAHNTSIAFDTPPSDLRRWSDECGSDIWTHEVIAPLFEKIRERVIIRPCPPDNACAQAFVVAGREIGLPPGDFGRGEIKEGIGWFQVSVDGTTRETSSTAYIHRTSRPDRKLTLLTDTLALKILVDGSGAAYGVRTTAGDLIAEHEVIVSGGTFESPKLLQLSGIGDEQLLGRHGIEVTNHLTGVGEHLIDHPEGIMLLESKQPLPPRVITDWECGLFAKSSDTVDIPDIMFHLATMRFDANPVARGYPTAEHVFSLHPNVTRPRSAGSVRLRGDDPSALPFIDPQYFTDDEGYDERTVVEGIRLAREISQQPGFSEWMKSELAPGPAVQAFGELSEYARRTANTVYHPAGTCKMGRSDDPSAVLDPELRVRGTANLRVADASIFPSMTTMNPAITCLMIGEKCAELILAGTAK